jgi:hypothetical protein
MIPANLVQAIQRGSMPPSAPGWTSTGGSQVIQEAAEKIIDAIERTSNRKGGDFIVQGPLWKTDKVAMGDESNPDTVARQLYNGVRSVVRARR